MTDEMEFDPFDREEFVRGCVLDMAPRIFDPVETDERRMRALMMICAASTVTGLDDWGLRRFLDAVHDWRKVAAPADVEDVRRVLDTGMRRLDSLIDEEFHQ